MSEKYYRHQETYKNVKIDIKSLKSKDLEEKVRAKKNEIDSGETKTTGKITVEQWANKWLEIYKKPHITNHAYISYKAIVNKHIIPNIGKYQLDEIKNYQLASLLNSFENKSFSYTSRIKITITGIFKTACVNNFISHDPSQELIMPKTKKGTHRAMTAEETKLLLDVCEYHDHGLWALFMYYCGLRPGEASAISWNSIDLDSGILHIREAIEGGSDHVKAPKTETGYRDIPIPQTLLKRLKTERERAPKIAGYLFARSDGKMPYQEMQRRWWNALRREMNIKAGAKVKRNKVDNMLSPDFTPYCLRHTYCTNLQKAGVPLNTAKYLMGHSSIELTADIYSHHDDEQTETARGLIDAYNSKPEKGVIAGSEQQKT